MIYRRRWINMTVGSATILAGLDGSLKVFEFRKQMIESRNGIVEKIAKDRLNSSKKVAPTELKTYRWS
jgi:hypothetical protein